MARKKRTEPAHSFLYAPSALAAPEITVDPAELLNRITPALKRPFNRRQEEAFNASFRQRLSLIWGPPGTGKTTVLAGIVLGWLRQAIESKQEVRIGVGASNYNAIDNVLSAVADLLKRSGLNARLCRVRSDSAAPPEDLRVEDIARNSAAGSLLAGELLSAPSSIVIGGTWMQLAKLCKAASTAGKPTAQWFDLLIVDEASQMPVAAAGAYFLLLAEKAHVVLAGDHKQLGPIYGFTMEETSDGLYGCIFTHLKNAHHLTLVALDQNYRNNLVIARWPEARFYPEGLQAINPQRRLSIALPEEQRAPPWWSDKLPWTSDYWRVLNPEQPVIVVTYPAKSYNLSNPFEAQLTAALACLYRHLLKPDATPADEDFWQDFWQNRLGIVTPHRAQMAGIRNLLIEGAGFPRQPAPAVDTVDRFQGLERDLIISSYSVADPDFVRGEEEFILDPRRFNVTLTRSCSKFILLISEALVQHLPTQMEVAQTASHLQLFVQEYCSLTTEVSLPFRTSSGTENMSCRLRTPLIT
jgi:hypothetical protein